MVATTSRVTHTCDQKAVEARQGAAERVGLVAGALAGQQHGRRQHRVVGQQEQRVQFHALSVVSVCLFNTGKGDGVVDERSI